MISKRAFPRIAAVLGLALTVACGSAFAHGWGGPGGHGGHGCDRQLGLLAHAAGLTHKQIADAFHGNTKLRTDFSNLHKTREEMVTCLASGASCTSQISAYSAAQQAMTQEKMDVWQTLFKSAPDKSRASSVLSQMRQLREQKHKLFKEIFSSSKSAEAGHKGVVE